MKQLLLLIAILVACNGNAQNSWERKRDSLLIKLHGYGEDTNKVLTMIQLGITYLYNQPDSAAYYAKTFGKLSDKLHYAIGQANSLSMQAYLLSGQDKEQEAINLDLQAIEIARKANLLKVLANVYNNIAIIYNNIGNYTESLDLYLKAAAIYEQRNDSSSMAFIYSNIAELYNDLKEYKSGYTFALRGIRLCRSLHQTHGLTAGMINLSTSLINLKKFDTARIVLNQSKELTIRSNDKNGEISVLANYNYVYTETGKYDLLMDNAKEMMRIAKSINSKEGICYGALGLTDYYRFKKDYTKAKYYVQYAVNIAKENRYITVLRDAYNALSRIELEQGNIKAYYRYNELNDSIDAVLVSDKVLKNTQELDAKYSLTKKQAEIDVLNKEKKIQELTLKQHNVMEVILAVAALVIAFLAILLNRNYRQKKKLLIADSKLQQQKITEMEKEKQLLAAQAVMQGQVEERTRLAKDLHDGLGSILSGAKYSFSNMKENMIITPENAAAFERSMGMLDKSISELRRVAHNMMPEALIQFGLDTALKDFCNSIAMSGAIIITYQSFNIDEPSISNITASAVYRIIQELVNNILKHAQAKTALVQLVRVNDVLSITVEDNGKGFDKNILQNNEGIGYLNLRNRVAYLNGTIDIQSAEGKGTSVNIEIPNINV